ncbi:MAG: hypothetical protein GWN21_03985 [Gammaproteobacteria bacterium]|nr:hypothetical protein [Gammaproteobacteria bacterium]NIP45531.1 hypothetical protein [Gammaproteobacteria bacterium]NIP65925.1 hypothetical protein [Gammaproteobacteria bacterium]NIQ27910.1 hypothetical protein [Gammaproteobacteria bacterium]NIR21045.1 hypothetical protein [Gammaproteobacteria bacterium]
MLTFLLFFLPIAGAWLLNVFAPGWRPLGTVNYGTLVQPARPVSAAGLADPRGRKLDPGYLSGRWTIVQVQRSGCAEACAEALARTLQVQGALGEDAHRVQRLLVVASAGAAVNPGPASQLTLALARDQWLSPFSFDDEGARSAIYLVDPQGYLMMRYPLDVQQRELLADLERLLKISKIG